MEKLILTRIHRSDICTCGIMMCPGLEEPIFSMELPWKSNTRNVSCIPKGRYKIKPFSSKKYGECFDIYTVPCRDLIRIHIGNSVRQDYKDPYNPKRIWKCESRGCILPGMKLRLDGIVEHSSVAMNKLRSVIDSEWEFEII
jgi:hypothetical protein